MAKLTDLNECERERAKVNKKGVVLCLQCEKYPAKISEYGMLRKCTRCQKERFGPMVRTMEGGVMKNY
jgi:uncharacterized CHY-type Zn-finger protein